MADKCETCKHNASDNGWMICDSCVHEPSLEDKYEPLTNADHIRGLKDEELAEFLDRVASVGCPHPPYCCIASGCGECRGCIETWLQQPYESPTGQKG